MPAAIDPIIKKQVIVPSNIRAEAQEIADIIA
jgi:hypothetical protein